MKKIITVFTGIVFGTLIFLGCGFGALRSLASSEYTRNLSGATFITAVHGQDENNNEILVALYDKNGDDIVYVNDGHEHAFTDYTLKKTELIGVSNAQKITVNDSLVYYYFELNDGTPCLMAEDGTIYVCEFLDGYTVKSFIES